MDKYFMHRIQRENGVFSKGIEVHDTLDSAAVSFWGRMKLAYGANPNISFMHCKITDGNGETVKPYDKVWKSESETENIFFLHHIRLDGNTFDKNIDDSTDLDALQSGFAAQMEYGHNNPQHPKVSFVYNSITDLLSGGLELSSGKWIKVDEPAPEEQTEATE